MTMKTTTSLTTTSPPHLPLIVVYNILNYTICKEWLTFKQRLEYLLLSKSLYKKCCQLIASYQVLPPSMVKNEDESDKLIQFLKRENLNDGLFQWINILQCDLGSFREIYLNMPMYLQRIHKLKLQQVTRFPSYSMDPVYEAFKTMKSLVVLKIIVYINDEIVECILTAMVSSQDDGCYKGLEKLKLCKFKSDKVASYITNGQLPIKSLHLVIVDKWAIEKIIGFKTLQSLKIHSRIEHECWKIQPESTQSTTLQELDLKGDMASIPFLIFNIPSVFVNIRIITIRLYELWREYYASTLEQLHQLKHLHTIHIVGEFHKKELGYMMTTDEIEILIKIAKEFPSVQYIGFKLVKNRPIECMNYVPQELIDNGFKLVERTIKNDLFSK